MTIITLMNERRAQFSSQIQAKPVFDVAGVPLPGFGEERQAEIIGLHGAAVKIRYKFFRNRPFFKADGNDSNPYHIKINQNTGDVEKVLGAEVYKGSGVFLFQPIDGKYAYRIGLDGKVEAVFIEESKGKYKKAPNEDLKSVPPLP